MTDELEPKLKFEMEFTDDAPPISFRGHNPDYDVIREMLDKLPDGKWLKVGVDNTTEDRTLRSVVESVRNTAKSWLKKQEELKETHKIQSTSQTVTMTTALIWLSVIPK